MKLTKTTEKDAFLEAVNACKGDVWLESPKGDRYNLKSTFSQFLALGALLEENGDDLELFCSIPAEEGHFFKFFRQYPEVL